MIPRVGDAGRKRRRTMHGPREKKMTAEERNRMEEIEESEDNHEFALALWRSSRGSHIIGRALCRAPDAMRTDRHPAWSDITDMKLFAKYLFPESAEFDRIEREYRDAEDTASVAGSER